MATDTNIQTVKNMYEAFGRGNVAAIQALMTDDVNWAYPGPPQVPWSCSLRGRDATTQFFDNVMNSVDIQLFSPDEFYGAEDRVIVAGRFAATVRSTAKPFSTRWVHVWTFRGGLVSDYHQFQDSAPLLEAFRA